MNNCATFDTISCIIVSQQSSAPLLTRGKVSIAAIWACHFIEAEDFNWSRAVNSQLTVLQWDCGAGGSPDYQSRPSAAGFPVQLPHKALSFIFLSLLPRLSSISGWLWATYCWCVFYSFFFFSYIYLLTQVTKLQIVPGLGVKPDRCFQSPRSALASGAVAHIHIIINIHVSQRYTNYP